MQPRTSRTHAPGRKYYSDSKRGRALGSPALLTSDSGDSDIPRAYGYTPPNNIDWCGLNGHEPESLDDSVEVGDHALEAVKARIGEGLYWFCRHCDRRRENTAQFREVECR